MKYLAGWIAMVGCLFGAVTVAAESEYFELFEIELAGQLRTGVIVDLDADGRLDVVVLLSRKDDPGRLSLTTCLQLSRGFSKDCKSIRIPEDARVFDIGEVDGTPGVELVMLTDQGIRIASFANGNFGALSPLLELRTLFSGTEPGKTARLRILFDIDSDKQMELVIPTVQGPRIFRYSKNELIFEQQIDNPAEIIFRLGSSQEENLIGNRTSHATRSEVRFAVPHTFVEDFDGDGLVDLITLAGKQLRVFLRQSPGLFALRPSFEWDRSELDAKEREDLVASEGLVFADLNGDGKSDIIATKWASPNERTQIDRHIYFAREAIAYPDEPDQKVRSENIDLSLIIVDLNGDGRSDLVVPYFHFAITQAVKVITQNSIKIQFRIYLMGHDGRYGQDEEKSFARVDRRIGLTYEIDIMGFIFGDKELPAETFKPLISFDTDVNGDGYPDLIADTGSNRLTFYWGNDRAEYSRSPDHVIDHPSTLNYDLADLNGDGKMDVVTYHGPTDRTTARRIRKRRKGAVQPKKPRSQLVKEPRGPVVKILLSR